MQQALEVPWLRISKILYDCKLTIFVQFKAKSEKEDSLCLLFELNFGKVAIKSNETSIQCFRLKIYKDMLVFSVTNIYLMKYICRYYIIFIMLIL